MKKRQYIALGLAILMLCLWSGSALGSSFAYVRGGWLRLRANPGYDATVLASYRTGTAVTVLSQEYGWARVLTPDYRIGYMDIRYLSFSAAPTPVPAPTQAPVIRTWTEVNRTAYVTSQNGRGVRLRSAPAVNNSNVMGLYPVGRTVKELRVSSDGWSYIQIDKKHGYMMSQFLTTRITPVVPTIPTPVVPGPVETPTPEPPSPVLSVTIDPYWARVGDTIRLNVSPASAEYTAVWYNDQNVLLSTARTYQVRAADAGHTINVRILGAGSAAGYVANASTGIIQAAPEP